MDGRDWLARAAARTPDRIAVEGADETLTYARLEERAEAFAGDLRRRGVVAGDPVALDLPAGAGFAGALFGCLRIGAAAVPLDRRLAAREREERLGGTAAVIDRAPERSPGGDTSAPPRGDTEAEALRLYTSGTAGAPKPVGLTRRNFAASARGSAQVLGLDPDERWLCVLPLSHVGGLSILIRSVIYGTTAIVHDGFDTDAVVSDLRGGRATLVSLVPTTLARLLDAGLARPPGLRCALIGGAPFPAALAQRAREAEVPLAQTYGLTEACSQVTTSRIGEPETAGAALPGTVVELAADGEILVSGPTVAPGSAGPDGRLRTGDLGEVDERGRLTVTGRKAETIVTGGENVAPADVERVLLEHPSVAEAAVHGRAHPEWGEAVVATVVAAEGTSPTQEELRAHCAARLAGYKVPKEITFARELPRTASGKPLRRALR